MSNLSTLIPNRSSSGITRTTATVSSLNQKFGSIHRSRRYQKKSLQQRGVSSDQQQRLAAGVLCRAAMDTFTVNKVATKPIDGQKTGTSGLRKKTHVFMSENYLANWIQSLFLALGDEAKGQTIGLGGDGRYFNKQAVQIILKLAAGNGVKKVVVGQNGFMATPAMSALIRQRGLYGGLIMSASHNPAGPDEDWGIKFNYSSGEPAPEKITDKIFGFTQSISELMVADIPDIDLSSVGVTRFGDFEVEVVDYTKEYFDTLKEVFDFDALKKFVSRSDVKFVFDAMHAITGAYAEPLFVDALGAPADSIRNSVPLEDFGGGHPDPNLTYAKELVDIMFSSNAPTFGAASDGDGDRNMILGNNFFVTPSDSVAVIAANAQECIPYFKNGLKGVARSMPTSAALDNVANDMGIPFYETPTGWKFFGNLMDADKCSICGEESFGTGADHVREKDGLWAVLAWLSILAKKNENAPEGSLVSIKDIVNDHWKKFGRNFYSRYDYEGVESESANKMMAHLQQIVDSANKGDAICGFKIDTADNFTYTDPIDGSVAKNQGIRFVFEDGSRIIFRLSGTGSAGATIRMYIETYTKDASKFELDAQDALKDIINAALETSRLQEFTGRDKPTVIT
ncbi:Phosphoglucomutase [Picochlorum sp. SENEW3]|nr:Phosphoglucomutase [Picochlorum sp. SENEW3]